MTEERSRPQMRPGGFRGGGMGIAQGTDRAKDFKRTLKMLMGYLKPYWMRLLVVTILAVGSTAFAVVGPKILGHMTNKLVDGFVEQHTYDQVVHKLPPGVHLPAGTTGKELLAKMPASTTAKIPSSERAAIEKLDFSAGRPTFDFHGIGVLGLFLMGLFLVSAVFAYAQSWIMTNVVQQITYKFRRDISRKINRLPLKYFDNRTYGEVLSRVTNDVDTVGQNLNQSLTQIITSVVMVAGVLIMMLSISWQMTLLALVIVPISLVCSGFIVKRSQRYFAGQQATLGAINGHIEEMFSGHAVMRAFNGEERSIAEFRRINGQLYGNAWRSQFLSGLMMPIMMFVGNLGYVGVAVLGGWLAIQGTVNIGDIQAFVQYVNQLNQPITQAANVANVLQLAAAAAERVFEFLGEDEESRDAEHPAILRSPQGMVEFDQVTFGYAPDKPIIQGFTAAVKPGQRIAIVGPTGAGKTTIVNLLMRFYDVEQGAIRIDGTDTRQMRRADVRKLFGMVLQDTWLFNGSIKDNIAYGKEGASEKEVVAAAKAAHADHFIRALPGGYGMVLNESTDNISQGEKQLLTIARAMLANPPMLILDEATSSVDTRTEALIQKATDRLMKGRTSFVIAHRLSTIRDADLILVMRDGSIVEHGTHDQLLAADGFYASLYNSQFAVSAAPAVAI